MQVLRTFKTRNVVAPAAIFEGGASAERIWHEIFVLSYDFLTKNAPKCSPKYLSLLNLSWWTFRIYFFFFCWGGGEGECEAPGEGGVGFLLKIAGGGGGFAGGGEDFQEGCLERIGEFRGGEAKFSFSGPKRPPSYVVGEEKALAKFPPKFPQKFPAKNQNQAANSTHHPHKIDDQHRECKTGGGA